MKKKYFVSVQAKTIMLNQGDASYELEVFATEEELDALQILFADMMEVDEASMIRSGIPGIPYHFDKENDNYDYYLELIYRKIYELGTEVTKNHIREMELFCL